MPLTTALQESWPETNTSRQMLIQKQLQRIKSRYLTPGRSRSLSGALLPAECSRIITLCSLTPGNLSHPHAQSILLFNTIPMFLTLLTEKPSPTLPANLHVRLSCLLKNRSSLLHFLTTPQVFTPSLLRSSRGAPPLCSCGSLCPCQWQYGIILPPKDNVP